MARVEYIDGRACHIVLTSADMIALEVEREIVVPRAAPDAPRALVVVLERGAA